MADNILHYDSVIESEDKYNGKLVSELIGKGSIFQMLKKGYRFDDEVLEAAHITHKIRDEKTEIIISDHAKQTKTYEKDTAPLKEILKQIETLENDDYKEDIEDLTENKNIADNEE